MRARWPRRLLPMLLLVVAAGCTSVLPKLQPPQLAVTAVAFGGGNLQQQPVRLTLHASNPNDRAIAIRDIECNLELAGTAFAQGTTEAAFTLPALGETDFTLNLTANLDNVLSALAGGLTHHTLDYRLYGKVRLQGGLVRAIPFDQRGKVRL